jgi:hypothetical protein
MFHMRKNITCILEQVEFHLETFEMNLLQHVLQIFVLNIKISIGKFHTNVNFKKLSKGRPQSI